MTKQLEFYFEFSSPYGFLGSQKIEELADSIGRRVVWYPFLLGAVYKKFGDSPLSHPLKKKYLFKDFARRAALLKLGEVKTPANFPGNSLAPCRMTYWVERTNPEKVGEFVKTMYANYWIDGREVGNIEDILDVVMQIGLSKEDAKIGVQEQETKDRAREVTDSAIEKGVFGSPFISIDNELFWGTDRFDDIKSLYG